MKLEGTYDLPAPRERVFEALLDPERLAKVIPGCETLEPTGPGEYRATMKVGIAAVKGTFHGKVRIADPVPPERYRMAVEGDGGPGFVRGDATLSLTETDGGTRVSYQAEIQVGGLIAGVGQRMLGGVAKMMLEQFFSRMAQELETSA